MKLDTSRLDEVDFALILAGYTIQSGLRKTHDNGFNRGERGSSWVRGKEIAENEDKILGEDTKQGSSRSNCRRVGQGDVRDGQSKTGGNPGTAGLVGTPGSSDTPACWFSFKRRSTVGVMRTNELQERQARKRASEQTRKQAFLLVQVLRPFLWC